MALDCQSLLVNSTYLQKVMGQALMMSMIWEFNPIPLSLSLYIYIYINMGGTEHAGETCGSQSNTFQSFFFVWWVILLQLLIATLILIDVMVQDFMTMMKLFIKRHFYSINNVVSPPDMKTDLAPSTAT